MLIPKLNILGPNICDLQMEDNKGDHDHSIEEKIIVTRGK